MSLVSHCDIGLTDKRIIEKPKKSSVSVSVLAKSWCISLPTVFVNETTTNKQNMRKEVVEIVFNTQI